MRPKVHLLYFEGCPNVEEARKNLREALKAGGLTGIEWEEADTRRPGVQEGWKGFPSPSILVNSVNIETGEKHSVGTSSCNLGGAPTVEIIIKALKRR